MEEDASAQAPAFDRLPPNVIELWVPLEAQVALSSFTF
jgi:hypothetical protein